MKERHRNSCPFKKFYLEAKSIYNQLASHTTDFSSVLFFKPLVILLILLLILPQLYPTFSLQVGLKHTAVVTTSPILLIFPNILSKAASSNPLKQMCSMTLHSNYLPILTIIFSRSRYDLTSETKTSF